MSGKMVLINTVIDLPMIALNVAAYSSSHNPANMFAIGFISGILVVVWGMYLIERVST